MVRYRSKYVKNIAQLIIAFKMRVPKRSSGSSMRTSESRTYRAYDMMDAK